MTDSVFDDLLTQVGTGRWNIMFFISAGFWLMLMAPNVLSGAFLTPQVEHSCRPPAHAYLITSTTHNTDPANTSTTDKCFYHVNRTEGGGMQQEPCDAWVYDNSTFRSTITSQFDLVCSSEYLRATFHSVYMFGSLIGSPLNGIFADRFGRKTTLILGVAMYFTAGIATTWLPSLALIFVFRFTCGLMHSSIMQSSYILAMEVCDPRQRSLVGIVLVFPWAVGTMIWAGMAYLLRDWRWLQLAINLPAIFFFPTLWLLDESPRWLIVNGHFERAQKVLKRAARWNNVDLPPAEELDRLMKTIQKKSTKVKQTAGDEHGNLANYRNKLWRYFLTLFVLFRTPKLRSISLVMCLMFFMVSLIYYGLSLNAINYSADPFIYMALSGLVELPSYTLMAPIVGRLGRKWPIIGCFLVCGTVILAVVFIPSGIQWMVMTLAMVGKMSIGAAFQAIYLYGMELFPTEVRLQGIGSATVASRIGSMSSPFITEMLGPLYPSAPSLVFGLGAFVAGAGTMLLHETLGASLPDTIADLENSHRNHTSRLEDDDKDTEMANLPTYENLAK
ncbi:organic cation transporter protein-like [Panulirus ornatus]|uniref:organic cation transporter protein-like n=1 Tax=Panulirus ornatus TaxID=150431 RepID=UPI003A89D63F